MWLLCGNPGALGSGASAQHHLGYPRIYTVNQQVERFRGLLSNPNDVGGLMLITVGPTLAFWNRFDPRRKKWLGADRTVLRWERRARGLSHAVHRARRRDRLLHSMALSTARNPAAGRRRGAGDRGVTSLGAQHQRIYRPRRCNNADRPYRHVGLRHPGDQKPSAFRLRIRSRGHDFSEQVLSPLVRPLGRGRAELAA